MAEPWLECPRSWHRGTLEPDERAGLIARVDTGGTPSTRRPELWDGGIPWLTPKEIARTPGHLFVSRTERTLSALGLQSCGARLVEPGTVMLTKRAPVGAVAIAAVPMATNQGFLNFRCGPRLRPPYLAYWLAANRAYLDLVANGSTYPEIYKGDLFEFEIAVPDIEEQDAILEVLASFDFVARLGACLEATADPGQLAAIQAQTRRLEALSQELVALALSGRLHRGANPLRVSQAL